MKTKPPAAKPAAITYDPEPEAVDVDNTEAALESTPAAPKAPEPATTTDTAAKTATWGSSLWGSKKESAKEKRAREKREREEREAAEAAEATRIAEEAEAQRLAEEEAEAQRIAEEEAEAKRIAEEEAEAKRIAEEEAFAAALGDDPTDLLDDLDAKPPPPPPVAAKKKGSKDKKSKSSKVTKVEPVESKSSNAVEAKEEPVAAAAADVDTAEPEPMITFDEPKKADGWGFWGAALKPSKKATAAAEMKKDPWADQDQVVEDSPKIADDFLADDIMPATSPPKSAAKLSSKSKGVKGSSVRNRINALGAEAVADAKPSKSTPPEPEVVPEPDPEPVIEVTPEEVVPEEVVPEKKSAKAEKKSKKLKQPEAPPPPPSISPVPGGFPVDDLLDDIEPEPQMVIPPPKKSSKDKKSSSKPSKGSKKTVEPVPDSPTVEPVPDPPTPPADADNDELVVVDEPKLPTPPPEEETPREDNKPSKKQRPKVVRDDKSASWGFWGATPVKKPVKKQVDPKNDAGASSKATEKPAVISRSKSARKTSDRDAPDKDSKSSASDKGRKETKSRPSTSRGMSFGGLFSTPQPSRSKSTRVSSSATKPSSRRHSTAMEDIGLASPPPEMSAKAAKLTGVNRSKSTREKKTRLIPDPYPIDSDDMIMVDAPEDSAKDMDEPKEKKTSSRSKRHQMSGGLGELDDGMVDEQVKLNHDLDDGAFVERPAPSRRASTMKKAGLMGGIFGAFGASSRPSAERRHSRYDAEDAGASRRKRDAAYDDDGSKRLRREDRKVHRSSRKATDGDGLTDAAPITDAEVDEAREARRRERRERRAREEAEEADRQARRDERRRAKAREEDDRQAREDEVRRARRRARRAEEERLAREEEEARAERHERRRQRAAEETHAKSSRPTPDRRHSSYMDAAPADDDEARRIRREERRLRRSADVGAAVSGRDRERPRTSRRQSEYLEDRNGEPTSSHGAIPEAFAHAIKTGGDKTSSWVHSVNDAPPPPIEGTIIDAPVHYADDAAPDPLEEGETTAREFRHRRERRRDRDDGYHVDDDYRRRERVKSSSGDGSSGRRRSYASPPSYGDMYGGGMRSFDARPSMPQRSDSKRGSWFKKIAGL